MSRDIEIASLQEEVARFKRGKQRKAIPNPNKRFMVIGDTLAVGEAIPKIGDNIEPVVANSVVEEVVESDKEETSVIEIGGTRLTSSNHWVGQAS